MKKFIEEFKAFALKGNVMDLAVGVIIGGAFTAIVTAFTDNFINPLLNLLTSPSQILDYDWSIWTVYAANFLSAVVNFLIMALILFLMVKGINKLMTIGQKKEEEVKTTKICPYCKSEIPKDATKCAHCTSDVEAEQ